MAANQTVGDPGVPLLASTQMSLGLRGGEDPGVTAMSVSGLCFLIGALPRSPAWSRASAPIIHSCPAVCRGERLPAEAVKCFVHSFGMIGKRGHESSPPVSPLQDLPAQSSGGGFYCSSFSHRGGRMARTEPCAWAARTGETAGWVPDHCKGVTIALRRVPWIFKNAPELVKGVYFALLSVRSTTELCLRKSTHLH